MKPSLANNQKGQLIVEAVLIIVMLMGITFTVASYFRNNEVIRQLISGPWANLSGMLQNGIWSPAPKGAIAHPNGDARHITIEGEVAR